MTRISVAAIIVLAALSATAAATPDAAQPEESPEASPDASPEANPDANPVSPGAKDSADDAAASKDAASKDAASKDAKSNDAASKDAKSNDAVSKDAKSNDAASKDAKSNDAVSKDAKSNDAASKDAGAKGAKSKDTASKDAKSKDAARWSYFPIIVFSPETSLVLGGLVLRTFRIGRGESLDGTQRRSVLQLSAAYSLKNQFLFNLAPTLYLDRDRWQVVGSLEGTWFPSLVYELGNDADEESSENFVRRGFVVRAGLARNVLRALRAGLQTHVTYSDYIDLEPGGLVETGVLPGSEGGWNVGVGAIGIWDDRDSQFDSRGGGYYSLSALIYRKELGGDYNFGVFSADARRFFRLPRRHGVALQFYGQFSAGNEVPFESMSLLGGPNRMRGFFAGRFRDKHMLTAQAEYRLPLYWRFGGALFAGVGRVASTLGDFSFEDIRAAGGFGVRFALNPVDRINLRFDVAGTSTGDAGFYFQLGEAF